MFLNNTTRSTSKIIVMIACLGKNASKATVAKHATVQEYRASTGFECLLGWLYLQGKNDRIEELFNALWEGYKPE